jgi:hypothetical protein
MLVLSPAHPSKKQYVKKSSTTDSSKGQNLNLQLSNVYITNNVTSSPPASPPTISSSKKEEKADINSVKNVANKKKRKNSELDNLSYGSEKGIIPTPENFPSNQRVTRNQGKEMKNKQENIKTSADTAENPFVNQSSNSNLPNAAQVKRVIQGLHYWNGSDYAAGVTPDILNHQGALTRAQRKKLENE